MTHHIGHVSHFCVYIQCQKRDDGSNCRMEWGYAYKFDDSVNGCSFKPLTFNQTQ